ncbi:hypothetical protein MY1_0596 [Nitrosarchaeum koreense MY1]|uniref:Uncharacterized protein n=1 Tax=Nitrosarchaeum koreense MY1 TaxID=1001994 RepID=F9CVQ9_9ARCH|nr:hypothetical protein MY1_0596 [Nitrosarchaeum koreense MY1]
MDESFYAITNLEKIGLPSKKKQFCGYCPEDTCLLDCEICNPKKDNGCNCD